MISDTHLLSKMIQQPSRPALAALHRLHLLGKSWFTFVAYFLNRRKEPKQSSSLAPVHNLYRQKYRISAHNGNWSTEIHRMVNYRTVWIRYVDWGTFETLPLPPSTVNQTLWVWSNSSHLFRLRCRLEFPCLVVIVFKTFVFIFQFAMPMQIGIHSILVISVAPEPLYIYI